MNKRKTLAQVQGELMKIIQKYQGANITPNLKHDVYGEVKRVIDLYFASSGVRLHFMVVGRQFMNIFVTDTLTDEIRGQNSVH